METSHKIQYEDMTIPYELIKSGRKSYAVQINPGGKVVVRTPFRCSDSFLQQFFTEKEKVIKQKYQEQCAIEVERPKSREDLIREKALEERYRKAAGEYIPKRAAYYRQFTGGSYERIAIRGQKTRWGSCSSRGTLSFHWRLMLFPPGILDYVVVHELCHLTHMNHGKEFWRAVEEVLPDYKERRKWLKENGTKKQLL